MNLCEEEKAGRSPIPFQGKRKLALNPQHCDAHQRDRSPWTGFRFPIFFRNLTGGENPDPRAFGLNDLEAGQPMMQQRLQGRIQSRLLGIDI